MARKREQRGRAEEGDKGKDDESSYGVARRTAANVPRSVEHVGGIPVPLHLLPHLLQRACTYRSTAGLLPDSNG